MAPIIITAIGFKPCASFSAEFMVMPSHSPYQLLNQGGTSPCLFISPKTANVSVSILYFPSSIIHPAQPRHSIHSTNDNGLGLFATRDLKPTNLILIERPLLVIPSWMQDGMNGDSKEHSLGDSSKEWEAIIRSVFKLKMSPKHQVAFAKLENNLPGGYGPITGIMASNGFSLRLHEDDLDIKYVCVFDELM